MKAIALQKTNEKKARWSLIAVAGKKMWSLSDSPFPYNYRPASTKSFTEAPSPEEKWVFPLELEGAIVPPALLHQGLSFAKK